MFALGRSCQARPRVDSGGCFLPLCGIPSGMRPFSRLAVIEGCGFESALPTPEPPSGNLPAFHLWGGKACTREEQEVA